MSESNTNQEPKEAGCAPASGSAIPLTWKEYAWPEWVPIKTREQIESFWSESYGRSPKEWEHSCRAEYNNQPTLGTRVRCQSDADFWHDHRKSTEKTEIEGRWVPCWNNIGRVIADDGKTYTRSPMAILQNAQKHLPQ